MKLSGACSYQAYPSPLSFTTRLLSMPPDTTGLSSNSLVHPVGSSLERQPYRRCHSFSGSSQSLLSSQHLLRKLEIGVVALRSDYI